MTPLRVGLLGCGGIAKTNHLPALRALSAEAQLGALCDLDRSKAEEAAQSFEFRPRIFTSLESMLAEEPLDAVLVASPNETHLPAGRAILASGRHLFCEKPLGRTAEEASQLVRLAEERGLRLQVGLQLRWHPLVLAAQEAVEAGTIGPIYYGRAQMLRKRGVPPWGRFIDREAQGGGPLLDTGVHLLDLALHLMGHPRPASVSGMTWDRLGRNPDLDNPWGEYDRTRFTIEDFGTGLIRFESGAGLLLESAYMANLPQNVAQIQLFGESAGLLLDFNQTETPLSIFSPEKGDTFPSLPLVEEPAIAQLRAFFHSITEKVEPLVSGRQAQTLNAILDALYRSQESGREEPIANL